MDLMNYLLMFLILILGICLIITASIIFEKITPQCPPSLKTRARIALSVGSLLVSFSLSYFMCDFSYRNYKLPKPKDKTSISMVSIFSIILGISTVFITYFIDQDIDKCKVVDLGKLPGVLYGFSVTIALIGIIKLGLSSSAGQNAINPYKTRAIDSVTRRAGEEQAFMERRRVANDARNARRAELLSASQLQLSQDLADEKHN